MTSANSDSDAVSENTEAPGRSKCKFTALEVEDDVHTSEMFRRLFSVPKRVISQHGDFCANWEAESRLTIFLVV